MTYRIYPGKKAVSLFMLVMAFFLASCQPKPPPPVKVDRARPEEFTVAEGYMQQGDLQKALQAYEAFLKHAPAGETSALALKRVSEIYLRLDQPEKALTRLKRLSREYPDYAWIPGVRLEITQILSRMGGYQLSLEKARKWLETYPDHPLKGDVFLVMGDNYNALGDRVRAFRWWLRAEQALSDDPRKQAVLHEKLTRFISESGLDLLERFRADAAGTTYAPEIYYRIASSFLEQNRMKEAEEAAKALLASTGDKEWKEKGGQILKRVEEEMAVKRDRVGCLLPLSGPFAIYGQEVLKGVELGLGLHREQPGRAGLELFIRDTGGQEKGALSGLEDLAVEEKVIAVIGPVSSRAAGAVAGRAQEKGVPIIALTQRAGITQEGVMIFRNFLTPAQEIDGLVETAMGRMGLKRFGILYPDNAYGRYCMNLFWDKLNELGGTVTAVESYGVEDTDFADQIKKMVGLYYPRPASLKKRLEQEKPLEDEESLIDSEEPEPIIDFDAVFIPDSFERVIMIAPQLAFHDVLGVRLLGTSAWQSPRLIEMAGDHLQGALFCAGFAGDSRDQGVRSFIEEYKENFHSEPGILAANGYDTMRLLKMLLSEERIRTRRDLAQALLESRGFQGVTGEISFDSTGEAEKKPVLLTVSGEKFVPFP